MLARKSSGPSQRGQPAYSGHGLRGGFPWAWQAGRRPDRIAMSARHSSKTSSSLTRATPVSLSRRQ